MSTINRKELRSDRVFLDRSRRFLNNWLYVLLPSGFVQRNDVIVTKSNFRKTAWQRNLILFRVTLNEGVRRTRKAFGSRVAPAWREHRSSAEPASRRGSSQGEDRDASLSVRPPVPAYELNKIKKYL